MTKSKKTGKGITVKLTPKSSALVKEYAKGAEIGLGEAADRLLGMAGSRWNAVRAYSKKRKAKKALARPAKPAEAPPAQEEAEASQEAA